MENNGFMRFISDVGKSVIGSFVRTVMILLSVAIVCTALAAIACWFYDLPIVFSIGGGILGAIITATLFLDSTNWA